MFVTRKTHPRWMVQRRADGMFPGADRKTIVSRHSASGLPTASQRVQR
jgi:hypothetical protein